MDDPGPLVPDPDVDPATGAVTTTDSSLDLNGNVTTVTTTRDADGNLISTTTALTDAQSGVVTSTRTDFDLSGNPVIERDSVTNPDGSGTEHQSGTLTT